MPFEDPPVWSSTYQRSFNIFGRVWDGNGCNSQKKIQLVAPDFVAAIVRADGHGKSFANTLGLARLELQRTEERVETLIPALIITWYTGSKLSGSVNNIFPHIVPELHFRNDKFQLWDGRGPVISSPKVRGNLTRIEISGIVKSRSIGQNTCRVDHDDFPYFCDQLTVGDIVITGPKSSAADFIIKLGPKFVLECQLKTGEQVLSKKMVDDEVSKSVAMNSQAFLF